jgi:hypothetical protein
MYIEIEEKSVENISDSECLITDDFSFDTWNQGWGNADIL